MRLAVLAIAACTVAVAGSLVGYQMLAGSAVFTVRELAIRGTDAPTRDAIVTAVQGAVNGRSLLRVQVSQVEQAIERVPSIAHATVDRDFPSTLRIRIVPERAILRLCRKSCSDAVKLSADGRVLGPASSAELAQAWALQPIPSAGEHVTEPGVLVALRTLAARRPSFPVRIEKIYTHSRGVRLELPDGLEIRLGTAIDLASKLRSAETILRAKLPNAKTRSEAIYLSVEDALTPAIRWREPSVDLAKAYAEAERQLADAQKPKAKTAKASQQ